MISVISQKLTWVKWKHTDFYNYFLLPVFLLSVEDCLLNSHYSPNNRYIGCADLKNSYEQLFHYRSAVIVQTSTQIMVFAVPQIYGSYERRPAKCFQQNNSRILITQSLTQSSFGANCQLWHIRYQFWNF